MDETIKDVSFALRLRARLSREYEIAVDALLELDTNKQGARALVQTLNEQALNAAQRIASIDRWMQGQKVPGLACIAA